jgi:hypothetical protein
MQTVKSWSNALHVNRRDAVNNDLLSDVIIGHVKYSWLNTITYGLIFYTNGLKYVVQKLIKFHTVNWTVLPVAQSDHHTEGTEVCYADILLHTMVNQVIRKLLPQISDF